MSVEAKPKLSPAPLETNQDESTAAPVWSYDLCQSVTIHATSKRTGERADEGRTEENEAEPPPPPLPPTLPRQKRKIAEQLFEVEEQQTLKRKRQNHGESREQQVDGHSAPD